MSQQAQKTDIAKYLSLFGIAYIVMSIIASLIIQYFEVDGNIGLSIGILVVVTMFVAHKFVSVEKRVPSKAEKRSLVLGSLAIVLLVSALGMVVVALIEKIPLEELALVFVELPALYLMIGIFVVVGLYWLILHFAYGIGSSKIAQSKNIGTSSTD